MNTAFKPNVKGFRVVLVYLSFLLLTRASGYIISTKDLIEDDEDLDQEDPKYFSQLKNSRTNIDQVSNNDDYLLMAIPKGRLHQILFFISLQKILEMIINA